jgi:hypothetical protein
MRGAANLAVELSTMVATDHRPDTGEHLANGGQVANERASA